MKSSTRDNAEGPLHKIKRKVKETVGKMVGNPDLKTEGKIEKIMTLSDQDLMIETPEK
jgi:uncharacterized protein YjbJ (UPF0337 family)